MTRLSFDISDETWDILSKTIPRGLRKYVYRTLVEGLAAHLKQDPAGTLTQLIAKTWTVERILGESKL